MKRIILVSLVTLAMTLVFSTAAMAKNMQDKGMYVYTTVPYATNSGVGKLMNEAKQSIGHPKDQLLATLGKPNAIYGGYKDGDKTYRYDVPLAKTDRGGPHWLYFDFLVTPSNNVNSVEVYSAG
jgi:hypothetical protein